MADARFDIKSALQEQPRNKRRKVLKARRGVSSSKMLELDYYKQIAFMINTIVERFENMVLSGAVDKTAVKEAVHDESWSAKVNRVLAEWERSVKSQFHMERIGNTVGTYVNKADRLQKAKFNKLVEYGFGIDIANMPEFKHYKPFINQTIKANVERISNLRNVSITRLKTALRTAIQQGTSIEQMRKELMRNKKVLKKDAVLIARNEIKNLTSMLNKKRLQNVGFEQAEWSTSEDDRVRTDHKRFNGKIYEIGVGLKNSEGVMEEPGDAINCRCVAIPYMRLD